MENKIYNAAFGKSKAAFVLYEILQLDARLSKRVTNLLVSFNSQLNALSVVDTRVSIAIANIVYKSTIEALKRFPDSVKSYAINVARAKYRRFMRENRGELTTEQRVKIQKNQNI